MAKRRRGGGALRLTKLSAFGNMRFIIQDSCSVQKNKYMRQQFATASRRLAYPDDRSWALENSRIVLLASRSERCEKVVEAGVITCGVAA
jgi:hypothetical protein